MTVDSYGSGQLWQLTVMTVVVTGQPDVRSSGTDQSPGGVGGVTDTMLFLPRPCCCLNMSIRVLAGTSYTSYLLVIFVTYNQRW